MTGDGGQFVERDRTVERSRQQVNPADGTTTVDWTEKRKFGMTVNQAHM